MRISNSKVARREIFVFEILAIPGLAGTQKSYSMVKLREDKRRKRLGSVPVRLNVWPGAPPGPSWPRHGSRTPLAASMARSERDCLNKRIVKASRSNMAAGIKILTGISPRLGHHFLRFPQFWSTCKHSPWDATYLSKENQRGCCHSLKDDDATPRAPVH